MGKKPKIDKNSKIWAVMAAVSGLLAAKVTDKALARTWQISTGRKPPKDTADPNVGIAEAVTWAAATSAAVAAARVYAQRRAANYYVKSTGHLPAQLADKRPDSESS